MAEGGEIRSPTGHRTPGQVRRHGKGYQATAKRKKYRSDLGKLKSAGPGKDKGHKKAFSKGGKTTAANISPQSRKSNRGHGMTRGAKANRGK